MAVQAEGVVYLDPFAEDGGASFDPMAQLEHILERYRNQEVVHDYSADQFVAETEALMLDAQFMGMMQEAAAIEAAMHARCGDHGQQQADELRHGGGREGHMRDRAHDHADDDDHDEDKSKPGKVKRKRFVGWLAYMVEIR